MKKIFSLILLLGAAISFTGCAGEEDNLFDSSAAERLNEAKARYTEIFADKGGKWSMQYYPTNGVYRPGDDYELKGRGYLMVLDFDKDGSVKIAMDDNVITDGAYEEQTSLWEMIADNGPVLSFCTYNELLHVFSDPGIFETGLGFEGDYEFVVVDAKAENDYAMLKGKKRGTYNRLDRIAEDVDIHDYINDVNAFRKSLFSESDTVNYALLHGKRFTYRLNNMGSTIPFIFEYGKDPSYNNDVENHYAYVIIKKGDNYMLRFRDHLLGDEEAQEFVYDADKDCFVSISNPEIMITGAVPAEFFRQSLINSKTWTMTTSSAKSEAFKAIYDNIASQIKAIGATLANITIKKDGEKIALNVAYRVKQTSTATYYFDMAADKIQLNYTGVKNDASQNILDRIPALQEFINLLGTELTVSPATNAFMLNSIKIGNGDTWFVVNR